MGECLCRVGDLDLGPASLCANPQGLCVQESPFLHSVLDGLRRPFATGRRNGGTCLSLSNSIVTKIQCWICRFSHFYRNRVASIYVIGTLGEFTSIAARSGPVTAPISFRPAPHRKLDAKAETIKWTNGLSWMLGAHLGTHLPLVCRPPL